MLNPTYDPLRGFSIPGTKSHVNIGWLRTPDEFTEDCLMLQQRPLFDSWALSTQMPDETVRVLQSPLVPKAAGLALLESEQGIIYPVVTLQSASLQVRMVLSLVNTTTQRWLRDVTAAGFINVAVEIPELNQVAVIGAPCPVPAVLDVESYIRRCAAPDRDTFLRDAGRMSRGLAEAGAMPSILSGFETEDVRLVLAFGTGPDGERATPEAAARVLN
jgi:hypothetical protein